MARERGGFWAWLTATVFAVVTQLISRSCPTGAEEIPAVGPALIVSNHVSYLDPLFTGVFVYRTGRVPRFFAKHSLWTIPVVRRVMAATGQIPVYRNSPDAHQSVTAGARALGEGKVVVIYPEGTVTRDPAGWPETARTGAARLALATDAPVLPMIHWGTREVYDHYQRAFRPLPRKKVTVHCGPPMDLSAYRNRPVTAALLREVTDVLMEAIRGLLAEVRREPASGDPPPDRARQQ